MATALDIYQDQTDRASNALWRRDYEAVQDTLSRPHRSPRRITTRTFLNPEILHDRAQQDAWDGAGG